MAASFLRLTTVLHFEKIYVPNKPSKMAKRRVNRALWALHDTYIVTYVRSMFKRNGRFTCLWVGCCLRRHRKGQICFEENWASTRMARVVTLDDP